MLIPTLFSLLLLSSATASPSHQDNIQDLLQEMISGVYTAEASSIENKTQSIQHLFSEKGLVALRSFLQVSGNALLTQNHQMTASVEIAKPSIEASVDQASRWIVHMPMTVTYHNHQARIIKPVETHFEVYLDSSNSDHYLIDHITETITGDIQMLDKGLRRQTTCPMYKPDGE